MRNKRDMDFIHDMLVKLDTRLDDIDITLAKQETQIEYHIKRTDLLESEIKPVKDHVSMVNGVGKFLGVLALIATIVAAFRGLL